MVKKALSPVLGGSLILVVAQAITLLVVFQEQTFVVVNQIPSPQATLEYPVAYFFGAVVVLALVLFLIPLSKLKYLLKALFTFLFSWGIFIFLALYLPVYVAAPVALAAGLVWLLNPRVWLHDLLLMLAVASVGLVFGFILAPWTAMAFLLVVSVYDVLSVRFGHMMWMARKLTDSDVLPAFVLPVSMSNWNLNLKGLGFQKLFEDKTEKEFSMLGGGDIGFPLLLTVAVFFNYGIAKAIIVGAFSLVGLIGAYWIQAVFLKGKPMPALPPISLASLIGFLLVSYVI